MDLDTLIAANYQPEEILEMNDPNLKVGDTVRMQYPRPYNYGWIDIQKRKPEIDKRVLVVDSAKIIYIDYLIKDDCWDECHIRQEYTHWMELPRLPA